uniref:Ice-binding protein n=1 Tax=Phaeocystis antarctica TaxID=33657 RepID=A0A7S0F470_9EUKA|mmetsp:Transcript_35931/g.84779  ORF Transcript_35931/g.84779 Transcript_35931/m.84779 type:complete len:267 (+) Transcript_35931:100-900(+)
MLSHSVLSLGSLLLALNFHGADSATTPLVDENPRPVVLLGTAGDFAILTKTGVTTTGVTDVTGDMGTSPIAAAALTGFSLTIDSTNTFSLSTHVTGKLFAASYTSPTPSKMTTAISDLVTACKDAAGRVNPDVLDLGAGTIDGLTLAPGLYKWGSSVDFTKLTFKGKDLAQGADPVWILQVTGDLIVGAGAIVTLTNGALAKNIFWQVAGSTTLHTTAAMKGIILCAKSIVFQTGSSLNGKALAQTAVTLDATTIKDVKDATIVKV